MKLAIHLGSVLSFFLVYPLLAASLVGVLEQNDPGLPAVAHQIDGTGTTFESADMINLSFELQIAEKDVGISSSLHVVARLGDIFYMKAMDGTWQFWDVDADSLVPYEELILPDRVEIDILSDDTLPMGAYLVYAGYKTRDGEIIYNSNPAVMVVFDEESNELFQVNSRALLRDFLYRGAINPFYSGFSYASFSPAANAFDSQNDLVSGTNIQEQGVDEADRIKTDGDALFSLERCVDNPEEECLTTYRLSQSPASAAQLSSFQLTDNADEMYYYSDRKGEIYVAKDTESSARTAIWLDTTNQWYEEETSYEGWFVSSAEIILKFVDVRIPEDMQSIFNLSIEGNLISSRLIDGTLYLVTEKTTNYNTWAVPETKEGTVPEKPPLDLFLPHYTANNGEPIAFLEPENCYIPAKMAAKNNLSSLLIITAIPVFNPTDYNAFCVAGELETFYASGRSLYLATSRFPYTVDEVTGRFVYDYEGEQFTEIHKFSFEDEDVVYKGSGQVPGHLGWEFHKKLLRMGEYEDTLRIATSSGSVWNNDTATRVSVLKEDEASFSLNEISHIDGLGKPGEELYAARFVGERGYLVTFRVKDPLIAIDFSDPETPKVLGELVVNGYSDYLQPIGENYLLGIGKDVILDESGDFGGAWYQGVKVSLFDVTDGNNLNEVDSIILGNRGTESPVLFDPHGIAWLAVDETTTKLALPIELHDNFEKPFSSYNFFFGPDHPSTFSAWTHTGLYVFDINTGSWPDISLDGKLITESTEFLDPALSRFYDFMNDRAVIQNGTVHYIHDNTVFSSGIEDLE